MAESISPMGSGAIRPYEHHAKYYETDQMGIIHHSNYIRWMEEARLDLMEQMEFSYQQMEALDVFSPVLSVSCEYRSMVRFNDTVSIAIHVLKYNGVRFRRTSRRRKQFALFFKPCRKARVTQQVVS